VLAYPAANAALDVHLRPLQPYLNLEPAAWFGRLLERLIRPDHYQIGGIAYDKLALSICSFDAPQIIVSGSELVGRQSSTWEFYVERIGSCDLEHPPTNGAEKLSHKYRFRAYGTVLLANDARLVHCPWKTASGIDKSRSYPYRSSMCEIIPTPLFIQAQRADCSRGADKAAGYAVWLAAAGANSKIQDGSPQALDPGFHARRLDDVGGADAHALSAFEAAAKEISLGQGTGRTNDGGVVVPRVGTT
jgi:hypothetical protein